MHSVWFDGGEAVGGMQHQTGEQRQAGSQPPDTAIRDQDPAPDREYGTILDKSTLKLAFTMIINIRGT